VRALLSVYDKTGVAELARSLHHAGVELVSSGGTARAVAAAGVPVIDVAELTGFPALLGHRVVTLHPAIHAGILADRDDPDHRADLARHGVSPIDIVVANLYPFGSDPSIELIDIGGPTLVRAAAKNHAHVTVVVDPADYAPVLAELRDQGATSPATRSRLARKAFAHTAAYDAAIVAWFDQEDAGDDHTAPGAGRGRSLPPSLHLALERAQDLRYGENPHQAGARYRPVGTRSWWDEVIQHAGVALSYLNLFDADAAWRLVHDLGDRPAAAIVKHANPCGVAVADTLALAYQRAFACDPRSAFGGIVALNRSVDDDTVAAMVAAAQADVVIAPGYHPGVVARLVAKRKNTRLLQAGPPRTGPLDIRQLSDSWLVQQAHHFARGRDQWRVVTRRQPTEAEMADAELAWRVCGYVSSNAIVLVKGGVAWGIGAGQQNRVDSGALAAQKAAGRAAGGACASDAFYPFRDGIDAAAGAGVAVVIQPGGSVRDTDTIAAAEEHGLAMIFTGERQFRH
jgi:phosphoribosylaminoimidazolecarboxamide formyltransferase/IMP cyclohydrolase